MIVGILYKVVTVLSSFADCCLLVLSHQPGTVVALIPALLNNCVWILVTKFWQTSYSQALSHPSGKNTEHFSLDIFSPHFIIQPHSMSDLGGVSISFHNTSLKQILLENSWVGKVGSYSAPPKRQWPYNHEAPIIFLKGYFLIFYQHILLFYC